MSIGCNWSVQFAGTIKNIYGFFFRSFRRCSVPWPMNLSKITNAG